MLTPTERAAAVAELNRIQNEVRRLAKNRPDLAEAIRNAHEEDLTQTASFLAARKNNVRIRYRLAKKVLERGLLNDPQANGHDDTLEYKWDGWCPTKLFDALAAARNLDALPPALEKRGAAAALKSIQEDWEFQRSPSGSSEENEHHAKWDRFRKGKAYRSKPWHIRVLRRAGYAEPTSPSVPLDIESLRRLSEDEFLRAALNVMGALADLGDPRPIVPMPGKTGVLFHDSAEDISWRSRLWNISASDGTPEEIDPERLSPVVARAMLEALQKKFGSVASARSGLTDPPALPTLGHGEAKRKPPENRASRLEHEVGLITFAPSSDARVRTVDEARQQRTAGLNPLLSPPVVHPDLKPLFDALINVSVNSVALSRCYPELLRLMESQGTPRPEDWPDTPAYNRDRVHQTKMVEAARADCAERGEPASVGGPMDSEWTETIREWSGWYTRWCDAIAAARQAVNGTAVAAIMNEGESRPAHRWTTLTMIELTKLGGSLSPWFTGGEDGLGFIRNGLPPFPQTFHTYAGRIDERVNEIRAIATTNIVTKPKPNKTDRGPAFRKGTEFPTATSGDCTIRVRSKKRLAIVNGREHPLPTPRHAMILRRILERQGGWVSGRQLRKNPDDNKERVDRELKELPGEVRAAIESNNRLGYRLKPGWS